MHRVGVASTNDLDMRSSFSNYGNAVVWVAAPGEGIVTTYPFSTYAAGWGTSPCVSQWDPTTYKYKIRKGVTFGDGSPLTPEDIVATIQFHMNPLAIGGKIHGTNARVRTSPRPRND